MDLLTPAPQAWYGYGTYDPSDYETGSADAAGEPELEATPEWLESLPRQKGLVMGRFLPVHAGHQFLIRFALEHCLALTVVVHVQEGDPIPGEQRREWLQELFPRVEVGLLRGGSEDVRAQLAEWSATPYQLVVSSEPSHRPFADSLGAEFLCLDPKRLALPVRATDVRANVLQHWSFLPECVRALYVRKVRLLGMEGVGKSTLAAKLAEHYHTCWAPEYAATLAQDKVLQVPDLLLAARAQMALEKSLARRAHKVLICDTDPGSVGVYLERFHGKQPPWLAAHRSDAHLTFLLEPRQSSQSEEARRMRDYAGACVTLQGDLEQEMLPEAVRHINRLLQRGVTIGEIPGSGACTPG